MAFLGLLVPHVARTLAGASRAWAAVLSVPAGGCLVLVADMAGRVIPIMLGKLVAHPAIMLLALLVVPMIGFAPIESPFREALILSAAMPIFGIYPVLAQKYGEEGFAAIALLATTVGSFFTVSTLLWYFTG